MVVLKILFLIVFCILLNKILIYIRKYIQNMLDNNNKIRLIPTRKDIINYGIDNYLILCKYIISKLDNVDDIEIQDITGKEVVDIKFKENGDMCYSSCILKDVLDGDELDVVTYDEVLELLNFMIRDSVKKGYIFTNSDLDDKSKDFIDKINKNSLNYNIKFICGYEIIKFERMRKEEGIREVKYA